MRNRIWSLAAFLLFGPTLLVSAHPGEAGGWEEIFFRANQAYQEGRFEEAIEGYRGLIRTGLDGGSLYYNLGNAYFKAGEFGHAVWAYERGRLLTPRDADLRFNLSHAREQAREAMEEPASAIESLFFWLSSFTLSECFACFALLNILFWSILIIRLFNRSEWLYYLLLITASVWLVGGMSLGLKYYSLLGEDRAVVLPKEVEVLAGPDASETVLFRLHEGTVVREERSEEGWSLIQVSDRNRGWIRAAGLGRISLDAEIPEG